jgi:hypothetical protein
VAEDREAAQVADQEAAEAAQVAAEAVRQHHQVAADQEAAEAGSLRASKQPAVGADNKDPVKTQVGRAVGDPVVTKLPETPTILASLVQKDQAVLAAVKEIPAKEAQAAVLTKAAPVRVQAVLRAAKTTREALTSLGKTKEVKIKKTKRAAERKLPVQLARPQGLILEAK